MHKQSHAIYVLLLLLLSHSTARTGLAQDNDPKPAAPESRPQQPQSASPQAWPGFDAPAPALVEFFLSFREDKQFFNTLGLSSREFESRLKQELAARPQEFAAAIVDAMPRGLAAWKAIGDLDKEFLSRLASMRALPGIASGLPEDQAKVAITAIQNDAARLARICIRRMEMHLRRPLENDDFQKLSASDDELLNYMANCVNAAWRIDKNAVSGAAHKAILIQPYLQIWPRAKPDLEKRRAVAAKYSKEHTKFFEQYPPLRRDEIVFLTRNVDRRYDLDWYRINREKFIGMTAQEIALKIWEMMRFEKTPFWPSYSIEEFFDGNPYDDSIAPNLAWDHPGIETFAYVLRQIRAMPEVLDVRVTRHPDSIVAPDGGWMSAECVFFWTRGLDQDALTQMLKPLKVTGGVIGDVKEGDIPLFGPPLDDGVRVFIAVWD